MQVVWPLSGHTERERRERRPIQDFHGDRKSDTGGKHLPPLGRAGGQGAARAIQRRGDLFSDSGECARRGCVRGAAVPCSGGQPPAGTAADDRRVQAGVGVADHSCAAVLLLCAAGPERQAARSDLREAGGGLAGNRGCEPGADVGFARAADSRLFRRAGRSLVWLAGAGGTLPAHEAAKSDGRFAGCGRSGAGAVCRGETGCAPGDRRQAPRGRGCQRSDEPDRRRARTQHADRGRHYRYGGDAGEDGRGAGPRRRHASLCRVHACGTFRSGGGADREVDHYGSGGDGLRAVERSRQEDGEDQSVERCGFAGARNSLDSRRDFDQRAVYLSLWDRHFCLSAKKWQEEDRQECLPADTPTEFRVDVSGLMLGKQLRANELPLDAAKMKLITEPERVLAHVVALKVEEEKPVEVVAAETATPAEPEVIKKGKKEVEGEEGAEAEAKPKAEKTDKGEKGEKKK